MRLFIRTVQGQDLLYDVGENDFVSRVIKKVPLGGINMKQGVHFRGRRLDLSRTLSSYAIGEDDVLSAVGAPKTKGTQQRKRRKRQMDEAIALHGEQQDSLLPEDDEEGVPTTALTLRSPTVTRVPARAARTSVAVPRSPTPRRSLKRKVPRSPTPRRFLQRKVPT